MSARDCEQSWVNETERSNDEGINRVRSRLLLKRLIVAQLRRQFAILLHNRKVHYLARSLVHILAQTNPNQDVVTCFKVHFNIISISTSKLPRDFFPFVFLVKTFIRVFLCESKSKWINKRGKAENVNKDIILRKGDEKNEDQRGRGRKRGSWRKKAHRKV